MNKKRAESSKPTFLTKLRECLTSSDLKKINLIAALILLSSCMELVITGGVAKFADILLSKSLEDTNYLVKGVRYVSPDASYDSTVLIIGTVLVVCYLFKSLYQFFLVVYQSKFSAKVQVKLSRKLFASYLNASYRYHQSQNSSELIRNINTEIPILINSTIMASLILFSEVMVMLSICALLFFLQPASFAAQGVVTVSLVALYRFKSKKMIRKSAIDRQEAAGELNKQLFQSFSGIKDLKVMDKSSYFTRTFEDAAKRQADANAIMQISILTPRNCIEIAGIIGIVAGVSVMALTGASSTEILTHVAVLATATFRLIPGVSRIIATLSQISSSSPSLEVIYQDLKKFKLPHQKPKDLKEIPGFQKQISINNLKFSYKEDENVLKGINITVDKGQSIGIVGTSGAGKSTLVDILLGLHNAQSGSVSVDEELLEPKHLKSWLKMIGYVPQSIYLYDDTIRRNIAYGVPDQCICEERLKNAIEQAQLDDVIDSLPLKLNTIVGENGTRLSGGQKQRVGIARALYNDPEILILDEATSALDNKTEKEFLKSLDLMIGKRTMIVIAHRLSSIKKCDLIYFLRDGVVAESGTYEQLSKESPMFREYAALL